MLVLEEQFAVLQELIIAEFPFEENDDADADPIITQRIDSVKDAVKNMDIQTAEVKIAELEHDRDA